MLNEKKVTPETTPGNTVNNDLLGCDPRATYTFHREEPGTAARPGVERTVSPWGGAAKKRSTRCR